MKIFTIGFTKKSARTFFTKLRESGAQRVVDVRLNDVSQLAGFAKKDETEDHVFDPRRLVPVRDLSPGSFWKLLTAVSCDTLADIFGEDLKAQRNGCAVDEGEGSASLGYGTCVPRPRQRLGRVS